MALHTSAYLPALKSFCLFVCLCCAFSLFAQEEIPAKTLTNVEARKAGCRIVRLKPDSETNCVSHQLIDRWLIINIYRTISKNSWELEHTIKITSWYEMARISFPVFSKNGFRYIGVKFEGNTGTETMQSCYMLIGWNGKTFESVLLETTSYDLGSSEDGTRIRMHYSLQISHKPSLRLFFKAKSMYHEKIVESYQWSDVLIWNPENFSFYDADSLSAKLKHCNPVQCSVIRSRINFLKNKPDLSKVNSDYLNKINLMDVGFNTP